MKSNTILLVGDFETTVYNEQVRTDVWASAIVEIGTEDVVVFNTIEQTYNYLVGLNKNIIIYYHNLKFDGHFWVDFFLKNGFITAIDDNKKFSHKKEFKRNSFSYSISNFGQWYNILVKTKKNKYIEFRDSLKLLPFSVKQLSDKFGTKHKKTEIEYIGFRYPGCYISPEEAEYIKNDVLVVSESLEKMFKLGNDKLTIGSCCFSEYKSRYDRFEFAELFPNLKNILIDECYGSNNADEYVRKSYRGGWCYLKTGCENNVFYNGITLDVNSLYPFSMLYPNEFPIGKPVFFRDKIPDFLQFPNKHKYYFVRFLTMFDLKSGFLPTIQVKNNWFYKANEYLKTTDIYNDKTGKMCDKYIDTDGQIKNAMVELTLSQTDFELFKKHYNIRYLKILDGCYFNSSIYLFDSYINKYRKLKENATNIVDRTLAKLYSNNLYGKFGTGTNDSFKLCHLDENGIIKYENIISNEKKPIFVPIASAITSYARMQTITAAQNNYNNFIYSDTDSIHLKCSIDDVVGVEIDDKKYGAWKKEVEWKTSLFVRQKTYIEIDKNNKWIIKCAGMPENCKKYFEYSVLQNYKNDEIKKLPVDVQEFIKTKRCLQDFKIGIEIPGKLKQKRICGGVILENEIYKMRD